MDSTDNFSKQIIEAVDAKATWFDSTELPALLSSFRNIKGYLINFSSILSRKGFIQDDPYKHEKKILSIAPIDDGPFIEAERANIVGTRLSDYDNMLDFICSYVKFTVESLQLDVIKKLIAFNNSIPWSGLSNNVTKHTAKSIIDIVNSVKASKDTMSVSMLNDILSLLSKEHTAINDILKNIADFEREYYKAEIRRNILELEEFDKDQARASVQNAIGMIRKFFPQTMGNLPFYNELVAELAEEEFGPKADALRTKLLAKLEIKAQTSKKRITNEPNAHETIMAAIRILGSTSSQFEIIKKKLEENKATLESQQNSFWHKLSVAIRKLLGLRERPTEYKLTVTEAVTHTTRIENVKIQEFIADIEKRIRVYSAIAIGKSTGYTKIDQLPDTKILEFLNKQLSECQKILILLGALDTYFKNTATGLYAAKIRGIKIELSALKGILHKANQQKADFVSIIEEKTQLQKLGIKNAN